MAGRAAAACGAALVTACGSSAAPAAPAAAGDPHPPAAVAAPATSRTAVPDAATPVSGAPARRASGAAGANAPAAAPAATSRAETDPPLPSGLPSSAPLRVELGATCVVPGGEQRIVVDTLPDAFVAFDNLYPDNRTGTVHGGAQSQGRSDATGRFTAVWRVAPGTPTGRVRVDVGVSARSGSAITMSYYRLAASC